MTPPLLLILLIIPFNMATPNTTIPSLPSPTPKPSNHTNNPCRLDFSEDLFGGVEAACVRGGLDRGRCCPVLAAWLFAAHARSALQFQHNDDNRDDDDEWPIAPDDSQSCVESLQSALELRGVALPRPNASCDAVLCFCGIRLHGLSSLSCPDAFSRGGDSERRSARPTEAVRRLERSCRNASYVGCSRCLRSLNKVTEQNVLGGGNDDDDDRAAKMFARDCELMGLTWLLAKNKTTYIPTVSAVLRAILYTSHPSTGHYRCSRDHENMPLAVGALQIQHQVSYAVSLPSNFPLLFVLLFYFYV